MYINPFVVVVVIIVVAAMSFFSFSYVIVNAQWQMNNDTNNIAMHEQEQAQ